MPDRRIIAVGVLFALIGITHAGGQQGLGKRAFAGGGSGGVNPLPPTTANLVSAPIDPASARAMQTGSMAFNGGGSGGGNPLPPNAIAPVAPTFVDLPGRGPLLVTLGGPARRLVVLRDRIGRLLDLAVTDGRGRALLAVPVEGALLDLPGTEVVGLPVTPGGTLTIVADSLTAP